MCVFEVITYKFLFYVIAGWIYEIHDIHKNHICNKLINPTALLCHKCNLGHM